MKTLALCLAILAICLFQERSVSSEKKIILVDKAENRISDDLADVIKNESEENKDGGYNADANLVDCFSAMKYYYTGGRYHREPVLFRMYSPPKLEPGRKYPLVLWLHGFGESDNDNMRQLSHLQKAMDCFFGENRLEFFMIATQCPKDNPNWFLSVSPEGQGDAPIAIADEILRAVIEEYPVDTDRLGVMGLCSGGDAAWKYVAKHPGRFASLVPCSASVDNLHSSAFADIAVWVFNNKNDTVPYQSVKDFIGVINDQDGNAYLTLGETGGHDTWSNALTNKKVLSWMILQHLDKNGPPQNVDYCFRTRKSLFVMFGLPCLIILVTLLMRTPHAFKS